MSKFELQKLIDEELRGVSDPAWRNGSACGYEAGFKKACAVILEEARRILNNREGDCFCLGTLTEIIQKLRGAE